MYFDWLFFTLNYWVLIFLQWNQTKTRAKRDVDTVESQISLFAYSSFQKRWCDPKKQYISKIIVIFIDESQ